MSVSSRSLENASFYFSCHAPLLFFLLIATCSAAQAADETTLPSLGDNIKEIIDPFLHWTITPSVGVKVVTLDIKRRSDGYSGIITNDGSFTDPMYAALDIETPVLLLSETAGITLRSHSQTFNVSRQRVPSATAQGGSDYKNLGTSISGFYSYIAPTFFIRSYDSRNHVESRLGFGIGEWKGWFQGSIILVPDGTVPTASMPRSSVSGTFSGSTGPFLFVQGRGKKSLFEMSISRVSFNSPDYKTDLDELGMSIGYIISF